MNQTFNPMRRKLLGASMGSAIALAAAPAMAKDKLVFAYLIDPSHELIMWAIKNGKVKSDKVDLEVKAVDINTLIQGSGAKRFDIVETAATAVPRSIAQGLDIRIVGTALRAQTGHGQDIFVRADSPIKSGKDLKGKTLATASIGSTGFTLIRIAMWKEYGLNVSAKGGDVEFVEMPSAAIPGALLTGKVDSGTVALSSSYKMINSKEFRSISQTQAINYKVFGDIKPVSAVLAAYPERLKEKPEAYRAALDLLMESRQYALKNRKEVFEAVAKQENMDVGFFETWMTDYSDFVIEVSDNDIKALDKLWGFAREMGLFTKDPPSAASVVWDQAIRVK
ncbi:MAG: ABC transporter substrate-binding protein [Burkholderiaceae bacterium]